MIRRHDVVLQSSPRTHSGRDWRPYDFPPDVTAETNAAMSLAPEEMHLDALAARCVVESERFYRGQPHDTSFAYELFRRALVERDELAWEHIYSHYSPLVENWVRRCGAFPSSGESGEYFVASAFARFWRAVTPERFASFANLASLLQYLQLCAGCVVIDSVRAQSWAEVLPEEALPNTRTLQVSPDEEVMDRISRAEFWKCVDAALHDEVERVIVFNSFVMGMKPSDIYQQRPDLFASVNDVYNVKRNVLGRLSRNQAIRQSFMFAS